MLLFFSFETDFLAYLTIKRPPNWLFCKQEKLSFILYAEYRPIYETRRRQPANCFENGKSICACLFAQRAVCAHIIKKERGDYYEQKQ